MHHPMHHFIDIFFATLLPSNADNKRGKWFVVIQLFIGGPSFTAMQRRYTNDVS